MPLFFPSYWKTYAPPQTKWSCLHAKWQLERAFTEAHIITVTETWLGEAITNNEVSVANFSVWQADRTSQLGKNRGGGVAIFVNKRWRQDPPYGLYSWRRYKLCPYAPCIPRGNFPLLSSPVFTFLPALKLEQQ